MFYWWVFYLVWDFVFCFGVFWVGWFGFGVYFGFILEISSYERISNEKTFSGEKPC